jgi:hypothetical protein
VPFVCAYPHAVEPTKRAVAASKVTLLICSSLLGSGRKRCL